jgi:uncharacterized repeat protein (TIGR01451 family)
MATMYTWDPVTGAYIPSDTGTFILNDAGAYVQPFSVSTDLLDYAPGSTATFTADVGVGDTVTFNVTDVAGTAVSGTNQPWTITDGGFGDLDGVANGVIQTSWAVGLDAAGEAFVLTATDTSTGAIATTNFTDTPPPPPPVPTVFAYVDPHIDLATTSGVTTPIIGDLIFANAGSALVTVAISGTGNFGTFVEVQAKPTEDGFNTTDNTTLDGKNSDQFNTAIKLSDLQVVDANGVATVLGPNTYYEFKLDLHQANSTPYISLDALQFWQSNTANLATGSFTSGTNLDGSPSFSFNSGVATLDYSLGEQSVLLNSLFTAGSGGGSDLVVLVKTSDFSAIKGDYVYLYSAFGYQGGDWSANSTFEEWGALFKSGGETPPTPHATLSVDKETFCGDSATDAHNISGGIVLAGSEISWTYEVTAIQDAVSGLVLTDNNGTPGDPSDDFNPIATLGADGIHNIGDVNNDGILGLGETWQFTATGTAAIGDYTNIATADGISVQDKTAAGEGFGTSGYFGADPHIHITKVTNGQANPALVAGQAITWTYTVTNTGNVALANIVITDDNGTVLPTSDDFNPTLQAANTTLHTGDENGNGLLDLNETWIFTFSGTAEKLSYTNHVTVAGTTDIDGVVIAKDACGDSLSADGSASSGYTGAQTLVGLTKGFWATHLTLWDVYTGDDTPLNPDLNPTPKLDWDKSGGISTDNVNTTGKGSALGAVTGSGDSGLLLGDLNHDGWPAGNAGDHNPHDTNALFFDLASAQALLNSNVTGDARIIMAGQALAAQLNEYNDLVYDNAHGTGLATYNGGLSTYEAAPNGLIEAATAWLSGVTGAIDFNIPIDASNVVAKKGVATSSSVDSNTTNDVSGTKTVISDSSGADYKITSGTFAFTDGTSAGTVTALSSSSNAWNKFVDVFAYHPGTDINGVAISNPNGYVEVTADGEGLKNALAAYNHGLSNTTAGFVISADGSQIGWEDSLGGTVYDIHDNTVGAFWGILEDQNLLHAQVPSAGVAIVGVAAHA